tara:strand:+ start:264 stop:1424 length:1161 start_codon:yes stop_codon:yes gene_type:complete
MKLMLKTIFLTITFCISMALGSHAEQGVTANEIVIGSNQDMSGPFAAFGVPGVQAAKLYFDKINADGGVHGRKIRFVVEDHGYQMPKAMQGLNKLVNSDKIFAMIMQLGTPMNLASFDLMTKKQIANVGPFSSARQMNEPFSDLKYAGLSHYFDQIRAGIKFIHRKSGETKICSMYIPSDFGIEIMEGAKAVAKELNLAYLAETTHKPDEEDFVGSLSKLKSEGCEVIAIALGVRQSITAIATAKKIGWGEVKFLGSSASFHTGVAKVPGGLTEGFYCAAGWADLVERLGNPVVAEWVAEYKGAFGDFPPSGALLGRSTAETLVRALQAAGKDLNPESFQNGMESLDYEDHILGNSVKYGMNDHLGSDDIIISQVVDGNWKELGRQ